MGIPRVLRLIGATRIQLSTGTDSERVTTRTGRRLSSASAHQMSPWRGVPRLFGNHLHGGLVSPSHFVFTLGMERVAGDDLFGRTAASGLFDQRLEALANGVGTGLNDSLGDELVDAFGEVGVDTGNKLCHANSIASCNAVEKGGPEHTPTAIPSILVSITAFLLRVACQLP